MSKRCYWVTEPGVGRVLIPGCFNRAIYGDDAICNCGPSKRDRESLLEDKIEQLASEVQRISAIVREKEKR